MVSTSKFLEIIGEQAVAIKILQDKQQMLLEEISRLNAMLEIDRANIIAEAAREPQSKIGE